MALMAEQGQIQNVCVGVQLFEGGGFVLQNVTFGQFAVAWLFRLTGWFHIHLFYSSQVE